MSWPRIAGLRVLQWGGRAARREGNLLLLDDAPGREALLKVYRPRRGALRETAKVLSFRVIEGKRGVRARERCALERRHLSLWRSEGFDVPALLDRPLPEGFSADTALWMEYVPGPLLHQFAADESVPLPVRNEAVARFGRSLAERQGRALELGERGLVMKHASMKHVILHGDRQVSFDLEGAYAGSWPLLDALADELGAILRSLLRVPGDPRREALGEVFLDGYARPAQLAEIADFGIRRGGWHRAVRRFADRRRRELSEYDMLRFVEQRLPA